MKNGLVLLVICFTVVVGAEAQPFSISFAGTGASITIDSVKVENLSKGISLSLSGSDILRLTVTTGINPAENHSSSDLEIFPNPAEGSAVVRIYPSSSGDATIKVFNIAGSIAAQFQRQLDNSVQEFRLAGLNKGYYLISVTGKTYQYSGKLLINGNEGGKIRIEKISSFQANEGEVSGTRFKNGLSTIDMFYTAGDRLKFTGSSGIYSNVIVDIPSQNKTITFDFIACTDGDNNNYQTIKIGNQVWMAENLKTTKFKNGTTLIPKETVNDLWKTLLTAAYCWCNNNEAEYKATYGALYNWYAASSGNLCPSGWHVPANAEWTTLTNYLTENGYGYPGGADQIAKSMAAAWGWTTYAQKGTPGNDQLSNNSSGFSALPAGYRADGGVFVPHGLHGFFWSSEEFWSGEARGLGVTYFSTTAFRDRFYNHYGFSVRCVKD
jgi:uncharacterized protein (TIGR02145 family)